jgi:DNA-directed RNA polymerase specialized sigma24 family protein
MEETTKLDEFAALVHYLYEADLKEYAFEVLETRREPMLKYRVYIRGGCSGRSDAEDLANWTKREAFRRRHEFDPQTGADGLKNWLREICRKEGKRTVPVTLEECCVIADHQEYGWTDWQQREGLLRLAGSRFHQREGTLTPQQKACFIGEIKGETQVETARRLGIAPQTVDQHRRAAIAKMTAKEEPSQRKCSARTKRQSDHAEQQRVFFMVGLLLQNIVRVETGEIVIESIIGVPFDEDEIFA